MSEETKDSKRIAELERQLALEKQKYKIISGMVSCGLWEYDIKTGELDQSRRADGTPDANGLRIPNFRISMQAAKLVHPDDLQTFGALCDSLEHGDEAFTYDIRSFVDEANTIWLRYEGYTVFADNGTPNKVIGRTLNVDAEKKAEQVVIKEAELDQITGLFTANALQDQFEHAIMEGGGSDRYAYFVLDIDDFTYITDTWGHAYGDYVLEKFAKGLHSVFMDTDTMARTVDDEFIVLKRNFTNPAEVYALARSVEKMTERIELKRDNTLSVSIGVSVYPEDGKDYGSLYRRAQIALEQTKRNPNSSCTVFEESMMAHKTYHTEKEKKEEIKTEAQRIVQAQQTSQYGPVEKFIVNKTFDMLASNDTDASEVVKILAEIGKYYHYNKVYTINYDVNKRLAKVRYYWEPKENPFVSVFDTIIRANWSSIRSRFSNDRIFISTNSSQLGMRIPEQMAQYYPNASLLQYLIVNNEETFTCISFEKEVNQNWTKEEQEVLVNIAKLLGIYIERVRTREVLADEVKYTHAIIENQRITNYAVVPGTFELVYVGDYTGRQYPLAHSGEHCYSAIMGRKKPCSNCPVMGLTETKHINTTESYYEKQNRWISTTASKIVGEDVEQCLVCWSDVTDFVERVRSKDVLTGQLTAEKFETEASRIILETPQENRGFVYFSFPQFSDLNDVWGYQACNEIMKIFATNLATNLKSNELFARITGANFTLLINYDDKERTEARITMMLQMAHNEVLRLYPDLQLNVWCGIYRMQGREITITEAMERANLARKSIGSMKDVATISVAFYTDDLKHINSFREFVENSMHDALTNREFKVFFQPKRDNETGEINGADALVRWITGDGQVLEPCSFQPIFEESGFITELDYYVHKETFRLIREWLENGVEPPRIALSSSWQYLFSPDFMNRTKYLLERYSVPAELIEMVIPEGMSSTNFNTVMSLLQELQNLGFVVEIDAYLAKCAMSEMAKDLPASQIKANPNMIRIVKAMEQKRLSAPMEADEFKDLLMK